ncbi:MAG TPA: hypothetical protein VM658_01800 [bacterium]|nr:hypothetical protein [bacterium]
MKKSGCAAIISVLALALFFTSALAAGPVPAAADDAAWSEVLKITGARLAADKGPAFLLGPLPGESTLSPYGALAPSEFMLKYNSADDRTKLLMSRFARSRLRELGRRGILNEAAVAALLGPEPAGVRGSRFFGIVEVPAESCHALINYLEFAASLAPGSTYEPSDENRKKIDRALQASLALSSAQGRIQYRDFDVVWSWLGMKASCGGAATEQSLEPGLLWLYAQMRGPAGLTFLPALPRELIAKIDQEGGRLFSEARRASATMPPSLAALTQWRCGE